MNSYFYDYVSKVIPEENILREEPMSKHTTFRVGGPAETFLKVQTKEQLASLLVYLQKADIPYFVLGNGSNLLVSDEGYQGVILQVDAEMSKIEVFEDRIVAQAGAMLSKVAQEAYHAGLKGLEFAAGIPGSVGGAVVMNAGAYGGEMSQVAKTIRVMDREGNILTIENAYMKFGYRTSIIKNAAFVVVEVIFQLTHGEPTEIQAKMQELMQRRKEKQPLEFPSAGSTFKRPEGHYAGQLITEAGLSGYTVGGAQVSMKHNGFIINHDNATAQDIMTLIRHVQDEVERVHGITLEPEIVFLGHF